jgi:hypothetical protein
VTKYWVSCKRFTGQVNVDDGMIVSAPAVWGRFVGQPLTSLIRWLRQFGGLECVKL